MIDKDEFESFILAGTTIPQLQEIYGISRSKVAQYKRDFGFVGLTPNSKRVNVKEGVKTCGICGEAKSLSEFYSNGKSPSGNQRYKPNCIPCENKDRKDTQYDNILEYLKSKSKSYKCEKCSDTDIFGFLDFHHIDPSQKEFNIGASNNTMSAETFREKIHPELDKCILLCPNCHRREHLIMCRK